MKKFTATQIAQLINAHIEAIDDNDNLATNIRTWGRKWFAGQIVTENSYNVENIRMQLVKTFGQDVVEQALDCAIEDIDVVRSAKNSTVVKRLKPEEMQEGTIYLLISHVNRHYMKFAGKMMINDDMVYLFEPQKQFKTAQDQYRALTFTELTSERWQIRDVEEQAE